MCKQALGSVVLLLGDNCCLVGTQATRPRIARWQVPNGHTQPKAEERSVAASHSPKALRSGFPRVHPILVMDGVVQSNNGVWSLSWPRLSNSCRTPTPSRATRTTTEVRSPGQGVRLHHLPRPGRSRAAGRTGGYRAKAIGLEMGQLLMRLGGRVTFVHVAPRTPTTTASARALRPRTT